MNWNKKIWGQSLKCYTQKANDLILKPTLTDEQSVEKTKY